MTCVGGLFALIAAPSPFRDLGMVGNLNYRSRDCEIRLFDRVVRLTEQELAELPLDRPLDPDELQIIAWRRDHGGAPVDMVDPAAQRRAR